LNPCVVFVLEGGKSFGEIALISQDSIRNASVVADETSDLLVIHRDLYNRSLKVGIKHRQIYTPLAVVSRARKDIHVSI
jgi:CRP-like cAMP-binding protein